MSVHSVKAKELFLSGYNCSQAVLLAFSDVTGLDRKTGAMLASSFGGGMGRMREVCGAVSGAFIVAGLLWGYEDTENQALKAKHYALIQRLAEKFKERNGSIICRELLGLSSGPSIPTPEKRTEEYYKRRPCAEYVEIAAEIIDEAINENSKGR